MTKRILEWVHEKDEPYGEGLSDGPFQLQDTVLTNQHDL